MKKILFFLLSSVLIGTGAAAQTLSVKDVEAVPGESVAFCLHVSGASAMTSMHFEVALPASLSMTGVSPTSEWTAMFSHEAGVVSAISTTANAFSGEGDVASVEVQVSSGANVGAYPVTISNIRINGETLAITPTFNINVVDRHTVELDENSTDVPKTATGVNVHVKRTINADEWSTICLPFAMTAEQCKAAFGEDVQIGDFTGCEASFDSDENVTAINVKFDDVASIEANHPYIIKVSSAVSKFTVNDVDIAPSEELSVDRDESSYKRNGRTYYEYNSFVGNYVAGTVVPENCLFISGNEFWYSTGLTQIKAFRGFFSFYYLLAGVADASRLHIVFNGDETTGVSQIENRKSVNGKYYDLQGRRVEKPGKGIYVRGGKKKVIR